MRLSMDHLPAVDSVVVPHDAQPRPRPFAPGSQFPSLGGRLVQTEGRTLVVGAGLEPAEPQHGVLVFTGRVVTDVATERAYPLQGCREVADPEEEVGARPGVATVQPTGNVGVSIVAPAFSSTNSQPKSCP
jgi:hypothetical protein